MKRDNDDNHSTWGAVQMKRCDVYDNDHDEMNGGIISEKTDNFPQNFADLQKSTRVRCSEFQEPLTSLRNSKQHPTFLTSFHSDQFFQISPFIQGTVDPICSLSPFRHHSIFSQWNSFFPTSIVTTFTQTSTWSNNIIVWQQIANLLPFCLSRPLPHQGFAGLACLVEARVCCSQAAGAEPETL